MVAREAGGKQESVWNPRSREKNVLLGRRERLIVADSAEQ